MSGSESYVVSEGYHDRAFWAGHLLSLGCKDPGIRPQGGRAKIFDPFGVMVGGGHFAFHSRSGTFIRVVPVGGKSHIRGALQTRLKESKAKKLRRLVVNVDADDHADGSPANGPVLTFEQVETLVRTFDGDALVNSDGDIEIHGGETKISFVQWRTADAPADGIPNQQTFERLICAALNAVYPARGSAVQTWLDSRPDLPAANPKEHSWSYLAGWHADVGSYEGFCSMLWKSHAIVQQLRPRLEACGAWRVAEALAG